MYLPSLSAYQTLENSQGTLDPLGLYTIADRLAMRLAPDLRERMKHPRYLTSIAVGAVACSCFSEEELAVDEVSPPWQVYEWYVISGLVRRFDKTDPNQLLGMPGREKTTRSMRDGIPLSANRYLKTPTVFGFHGVYRTLAKGIKLVDDDMVGEFGSSLVDIWENEQGLNGFRVGIAGTPGYEFRKKIEDAVRAGLKAGAVAKPWSWEFYNKLAESLAPKSPGKKEATALFNVLVNAESESRAELIRFLASVEGQKTVESGSEKTVHTAFLQQSPGIKPLLLAIQSYERVCRLLYNAFYEILQWMESHQSKKGTISQLSDLVHVKKACKELPAAFQEADLLLEPFTYEASLFLDNFQQLRESFERNEWVLLLFAHHMKVQRSKPPNGKAPWILEHSSDVFLLNTTQAGVAELNEEYVHQYRTYTLQSFLTDLGKL
ncbi:hypothetical protein [Lacibacter sediminis]|uniref:Uncharacterized protein n=1 Tax=Lacibacter sediminis TaxID=2760713 RepID=A0A7G5XFN8_9BACT|nr:hypothetical protein [Lacibacter sediminis]QNA44291.1 hypothetical protein H4075_19850 [Lacibacter sediminis]